MPSKVVLSDSFKRCIKRLKKRFPHVQADAKTAIRELVEAPETGAVIPGGYGARKLRVRNTDLQKGKIAGYRLIYLLDTEPEPTLYFLLLYAKSDQADVSRAELKSLLDDLSQD